MTGNTSFVPPLTPTPRGCFVSGTDTGVGKTLVSAALLHWCARQGWRSAGLKPVAAGLELVDGVLCNDDVRALRQASSLDLTDAEVGPNQFALACAPHIAAQREGRAIDRGAILRCASGLAQRADVLVVEGLGGFRVPLGADWDTADMACDLDLPVVLVVGLRLGCINHALLSAEAVHARGLRLAGWVGNMMDSSMPWLDENMAWLREHMKRQHQADCLGLVPHLAEPSAPVVAGFLNEVALDSILGVSNFS
jgi:dethiobiotin synthetase